MAAHRLQKPGAGSKCIAMRQDRRVRGLALVADRKDPVGHGGSFSALVRAERDLSQTNRGVADMQLIVRRLRSFRGEADLSPERLDPLVALAAPNEFSADVDRTRGHGIYRIF